MATQQTVGSAGTSPAPEGAPKPEATNDGRAPQSAGAGNTGSGSTAPDRAGGRSPAARARIIGLACDTALSPATFYATQAAGCTITTSLFAATAVAGTWLLGTSVRRRRIDALAGLMLGTYALMLAIALLAHDERMLLARDPATSGLAGLVFLASCATRTPALGYFARRLHPGRAPATARERRGVRLLSAVWGAALLAEALARLALLWTLPVTMVAGLSTAVELAVLAVLLTWTAWYRRRLRAA
ncbi:VC0807 family protein [Kitasatospora sp. HPMI-4]|uniref:VC0807 family protein n=1 Tax=Kitasatospora sp. HPMI-4 TaxID=3448443 RepID=UPI003F1DD6D6